MAAQTRPKRLEYAIAIDADGRLEAEREHAFELPPGWEAEHLVLAGLVRCTLTALAYHARRFDVAVRARGEADGVVTKRERDGRYAFVEIDCRMYVEIHDALDHDAVCLLLARAERGCFIGASLDPPPRYAWHVNGEVIEVT